MVFFLHTGWFFSKYLLKPSLSLLVFVLHNKNSRAQIWHNQHKTNSNQVIILMNYSPLSAINLVMTSLSLPPHNSLPLVWMLLNRLRTQLEVWRSLMLLIISLDCHYVHIFQTWKIFQAYRNLKEWSSHRNWITSC